MPFFNELPFGCSSYWLFLKLAPENFHEKNVNCWRRDFSDKSVKKNCIFYISNLKSLNDFKWLHMLTNFYFNKRNSFVKLLFCHQSYVLRKFNSLWPNCTKLSCYFKMSSGIVILVSVNFFFLSGFCESVNYTVLGFSRTLVNYKSYLQFKNKKYEDILFFTFSQNSTIINILFILFGINHLKISCL